MTKDTRSHVELTNGHHTSLETASQESDERLGFRVLEHRITPLVVIAIIAVLIGLLLPAV